MNDPEKESRAIGGVGGRRPGAGRPLGSPNRLTRPLKELAALQSEACLAVLVELRDHADTEQVRLAAANALLDRAHGKPRQEVDVNEGKRLTVIVNRSSYLGRAVEDHEEAICASLDASSTNPVLLPQPIH